MLTGNEIKIRHETGEIIIEPWDDRCVNPNSYDVHLGGSLLVYTGAILDSKSDNAVEQLIIPDNGLILWPDKLYLGCTVEYTETDTLVPMYDGRSSCGRLGLFSHITAGFGDVGFHGNWTLELAVVQPVRVYAGMRIGQLSFHRPHGEIADLYHGKYQDSVGTKRSELWKDEH